MSRNADYYDTPGAENSSNLENGCTIILDMLEHVGGNHRVKRAAPKG